MGHSCGTLEAVLRACRTRRPPKVTLRGCKTSVSYETSSTSHASSLQNERFVVTCQVSKTSVSYETSSKTHMSKSAKMSISYETSSKSQAETPIAEHTHHAALPSSFAIPAPPNKIRSHANPNVTATFTSTTTHHLTIPTSKG